MQVQQIQNFNKFDAVRWSPFSVSSAPVHHFHGPEALCRELTVAHGSCLRRFQAADGLNVHLTTDGLGHSTLLPIGLEKPLLAVKQQLE